MSFSLAFKSISHTFGLDPVSIVLLLLTIHQFLQTDQSGGSAQSD